MSTRARAPITMIAILTLLLIATLLISSAHSSLQQEYSIQNVGNILTQDGFADKVFFQYGAEAGVLQPPWEYVGNEGIIEVSSTYARTGTKSIYMYQKAPPKTEDERRCHLRMYGSTLNKKEGYLSWWVYVTSQMASGNPDDWGPTFGGWQTWFGPSWMTYYWWTGGRWGTAGSSPSNMRFQFSYGWGKVPDSHDPNGKAKDFSPEAEAIEQSWDPKKVNGVSLFFKDWVGKWVHLQVYWRIDKSNGAVKAWFNNKLVAEKTGIATDPRAYGSWTDNPVDGSECAFRLECPDGAPKFNIELYQGQNSYENWIWVDDVVAATEKIPESYGVLDR